MSDSGFNLSQSDVSALGGYAGPSGDSSGSGTGTVTDSGDNTSLAGLSGLFGAVTNAFSSAYRTINPTVRTATPNTLVYNPATGTYTTPNAVSMQAQTSSMTTLLLILGVGVVAFLMLRK